MFQSYIKIYAHSRANTCKDMHINNITLIQTYSVKLNEAYICIINNMANDWQID